MELATCLFLNICDVKLQKYLLVRKQIKKKKDQPHRCLSATTTTKRIKNRQVKVSHLTFPKYFLRFVAQFVQPFRGRCCSLISRAAADFGGVCVTFQG